MNALYRCPIAAGANPELSTAQLAARTGLSAGTLRMWEARHGFPRPVRLPGGHRRYTEQDAALVLEVLRLRERGLSLSSAIARARQRDLVPASSVYAGLRRRRPDLAPATMTKRVVLRLTRAIEDEYCAAAAHGLLVASFQRERFYRHAERRWAELTRTAALSVVLADFAAPDVSASPAEVAIDLSGPLAREWTLIVDAPGARACLAAWEPPVDEEPADADRRFEVVWSFDPAVVRAAAEVATELLWTLAPDVARRLPADVDDPTAASDLHFATRLAQRMVAYLAELAEPPEAVPAPG
ncbi:MAG: MerR family transcriptional regulator [Solirubrobacterales bacterium]|nr:MerR family transcriptional regulator [Solirubrobacterales bacterium]